MRLGDLQRHAGPQQFLERRSPRPRSPRKLSRRRTPALKGGRPARRCVPRMLWARPVSSTFASCVELPPQPGDLARRLVAEEGQDPCQLAFLWRWDFKGAPLEQSQGEVRVDGRVPTRIGVLGVELMVGEDHDTVAAELCDVDRTVQVQASGSWSSVRRGLIVGRRQLPI